MDTLRAGHLRGADDVPAWVTGSQIAWGLVARGRRRQTPSTPWLRDDTNDDGGEPANAFAMLREFFDQNPVEAQAGAAPTTGAVAASDAGAAYVDDDAYRNGGFGAVPASSEAISGLAVTSAGEARERKCTVCLQDFDGGDKLRSMPCSHSFHEGCIFRWLAVSRACPLCRHCLPMERQ